MLLVLMSVAMAVILSLSFLNAQVTATGMSENVARRAQADALAESGLALALAYIETTSNWRTQMSEGVWVSSHSYAGGSISITGNDGQDTDGNGTIEGDGDLTNDAAESMTLTSTGTFDGVSHTVHAVVTPMPPKKRLLLVVSDSTSLVDGETHPRQLFLDWNYEVTIIQALEDQTAFNSVAANHDVVYVTSHFASSELGAKLHDAPIGVVIAEGYLDGEFGLATSDGFIVSGNMNIDVTNNSHIITETLSIGSNQIVDNSSAQLMESSGTLAFGATVLAEKTASSTPMLAVVDAGGLLADSTPAAGRRVSMPWGGTNFTTSDLTPVGLTILRRSLEWASEVSIPNQIAHWGLNEFSGSTADDSVGGFDGTYQNSVAIGASGAIAGSIAAQFDGANDHVEIPHNDVFLLDEGTFAFWFKTTNAIVTQGMLAKDSSGYDTGGHLRIRISNGKVLVRFQSAVADNNLESGSISSGTWYHVAFTFGAGGMKLYANGVLVDSDPYTGGMGSTSGGAGNFEPIAFGVDAYSSGDLTLSGWTDPFSGLIDEVYAFSRELTQTEIQSLMTPAGGSGLSYEVRWADQP